MFLDSQHLFYSFATQFLWCLQELFSTYNLRCLQVVWFVNSRFVLAVIILFCIFQLSWYVAMLSLQMTVFVNFRFVCSSQFVDLSIFSLQNKFLLLVLLESISHRFDVKILRNEVHGQRIFMGGNKSKNTLNYCLLNASFLGTCRKTKSSIIKNFCDQKSVCFSRKNLLTEQLLCEMLQFKEIKTNSPCWSCHHGNPFLLWYDEVSSSCGSKTRHMR